MKRTREDSEKDYFITCDCRKKFRANAVDGLAVGQFVNWVCPTCGQQYIEPRQEPITLEAFEPSINKNEITH